MITGTFRIMVTCGGSFGSDEVRVRSFSPGRYSIFIGDECFLESDIESYEVSYDEITPAETYYDLFHGVVGMFAFGFLGSLFGYRVRPSKVRGSFSVNLKDGRGFAAWL